MENKIVQLMESLKTESPLIHCITNPITNYPCAQMILSTGAKPIMASHPLEVEEITSQSNGLLINTGSISSEQMVAMERSISIANEMGISIVLDAVGAGCSNLRLSFLRSLIERYEFSIIKGNHSEIEALLIGEKTCRGVDAEGEHSLTKAELKGFALKTKATIMISGAIDIITDGNSLYTCSNGVEMMSSVCGTGCMLGALAASFAAVGSPMEACVAAVTVEGIAGELVSATAPSSFGIGLIDEVYLMNESKIINNIKLIQEEI